MLSTGPTEGDEVADYRAFRVTLPSGTVYWTVLTDRMEVVTEVDDYLLDCRLGGDAAASTTEAYARSLALFLKWSSDLGIDWREAHRHLGRFVFWLQYWSNGQQVLNPTTSEPIRSARRVNGVLAATRSFLRHQVSIGTLPESTLAALYEETSSTAAQRFDSGPRASKLRSRHRLKEARSQVDRATDDEVLALVKAATNARDRFIVMAMWRMGLRRGEVAGLRREDMHLTADSTVLGCPIAGAHVHVIRRQNPNHASAKSRRNRAVPADRLVLLAHDNYAAERTTITGADESDFTIVSIAARRHGRPINPAAINDLLERLSARAHLPRPVHPHMLRHSFATSVIEHGGLLDELKELLGHASILSSEIYLDVSEERLRTAIQRVPSPRFTTESDQ